MVLTSKWGRILQEMQCQCQINKSLCTVQTKCRNADKIPRHTSEVNYVSMVLHCAVTHAPWLSCSIHPASKYTKYGNIVTDCDGVRLDCVMANIGGQ